MTGSETTKNVDPMCPENFRIDRTPGQTAYVRRDVTPEQLAALLAHPGEPLKNSPKAGVRRVGHWVVKESRAGGAVKRTLKRGRHRRAWLAALHLRRHQVRVPEPLAFVEKTRLGLVTGHLHVFQYLAGCRDVEQFALALAKGNAGPDTLRLFLEHLADAVKGLERAGAYHADLSGKNILTRDGATFYFIDLDAVTVGEKYDSGRRMKNHVQLYDSFCDLFSDTLMVPFIQRMLPESEDPRMWLPRVRREQADRRARIEAKWDRQGVRPRRIRDELPPAP